ncbi:ATP-dependent DNA ligase, partial [Candidatus Parcubacteria bacterium]|nr:ATP-dependent DNA ligase [Candidatus Parcubacteria bacterium]
IAGDKSSRGDIERAYNVRADVVRIAEIVKREGIGGLDKVQISLGTPVMPALCQRLPTAEEIIAKMCRPEVEQVAVEPKYDGERLQIHFDRKGKTEDQRVCIFTRGLENVTGMFPDLAQAVFEEVKAQDGILDGEVIGFDPKSGGLVHFQKTMTRKRKYLIGEKSKEVPLLFFCFDILSRDGRSLIKRPFSERRQILEGALPIRGRVFRLAPQIVIDDPRKLRQFHKEQVRAGLEGVVAKKWGDPYEPGRTGYTWVKLKQEQAKRGGGLADTIDGVVMGYYRGEGKRAGFGIGRILVGVRASEDSDQILTLTKVGTGPSDREWVEIRERLDRLEVRERPRNYQVDKNLVPDVWCRPELVVEIEADNVTKSSVHLAKYSLRFPRWLRFRDDKSLQQASTLAEIEKLYKMQG